MTWFTVLGIVLRLLEPALAVLGKALAEWLEEVLRASARELAESPELYRWYGDIAALFRRARGKTWRWQLTRRAVLRIAERAATRRAVEIYASVTRGGFVPGLSHVERAEFGLYGPRAV